MDKILSVKLLNEPDIIKQQSGFDYDDAFYLMPKIYQVGKNIFFANFYYMKVLPAFYCINQAYHSGDLKPGQLVVETTSGNFGYGLAQAWSNRPMPEGAPQNTVRLVTFPGGIDADFEKMLNELGATLDVVHENINGSYQITRLQYLAKMMRDIKEKQGYLPYWPQQYDNIEMRKGYHYFAHYFNDVIQTTSGKSADVVVSSVGTGASAAGVAEILQHYNPNIIKACVDPQGSVVIGKDYIRGPTLIGSGGITKCRNTDYDLMDDLHWIDERQAIYQMDILSRSGINAGYSTGGVYHVAEWYARNHPDKIVCMVGADCQDRYIKKLMTPEAQNALGVTPSDIPEPEEVYNPNVFTKPSEGYGWQYMRMTPVFKEDLKQQAEQDYQKRKAIFDTVYPGLM